MSDEEDRQAVVDAIAENNAANQRDAAHIIRTIELQVAVDVMAQHLGALDMGDVYTGLTCSELDSIADVLRAGGHADVAEFITEQHAEGDEDGDAHFQGGHA